MVPLTLIVPILLLTDVPPFFQPPGDFYGAQGTHVTVVATAEPTRVPVNRSITFTLTVGGTTNFAEVKRPPLHDLPEFSKRFEVADKPNRSPGIFEYELRPRTAEIDRIPPLRFAYYNPAAADGKQFPVTYSKAIPIQVLAAVAEEPPPSSQSVPAIFRESATAKSWRPPAGPGWLLGLSAGVLALAGAYVLWWRWRNPDGPRLARIRQSRAVRNVTARLNVARQPGDVAAALHAYLVERYGIAIPSAAPCDVEEALRSGEFDGMKSGSVVTLLRRCDAARFGDGSDTTPVLVESGKALVRDWEGLPC